MGGAVIELAYEILSHVQEISFHISRELSSPVHELLIKIFITSESADALFRDSYQCNGDHAFLLSDGALESFTPMVKPIHCLFFQENVCKSSCYHGYNIMLPRATRMLDSIPDVTTNIRIFIVTVTNVYNVVSHSTRVPKL